MHYNITVQHIMTSGETDGSRVCLPQFFYAAARAKLKKEMPEFEDAAPANIKPSSGECSQLPISLAEADINSSVELLTCLKCGIAAANPTLFP